MDCNTPGFPVHHQLLEPTQTHFHGVGNATQPSHPLSSHPFFLPPPIFPSIRVFSNESALRIRWPKYWSISFSISPSMNTQDWSPLGWTGWISLQSKGPSRVFSITTVQKHQFLGAQLSLYKIGYLLTQCFLSLKDNVFLSLYITECPSEKYLWHDSNPFRWGNRLEERKCFSTVCS